MRSWILPFTLLLSSVPGAAQAQLVYTQTSTTELAQPSPSGYPAAPVVRTPVAPRAVSDPGLQWLVQWNMGMPVFETNTFNNDFSWRGISLDARYRVTPKLSFGVSGSWQVFSDKELVTETIGDATITGVTIRHTNIVPMLATTQYHLPLGFLDDTEAYGGLGLGAYYVERLLDVGTVASRGSKTWHFGLAPEIGLISKMGAKTFGTASVRWHFVVPGADDVPWQSYFNFNVGLLFL